MSSLLEQASLLGQASSFHRTGNIKEAETIYKKIINESPNSFEANHALGAINLQLRNYILKFVYN